MTIRTKASILTILLVLTISYLPSPVSASGSSLIAPKLSDPSSVTDSDKKEQSVVLREIDIEDLKSFPVIQQPHGNSTFVSPAKDYVTEYQIASNYGTIGLLAHNYLAGRYFFQVLRGQEITLVYSDASTERFVVSEIQRYQALVPDSPSSDFIDLATGEYLTASQLFRKNYGNRSGYLILQTCIYAEQNASWGRLFIIAKPVEQAPNQD